MKYETNNPVSLRRTCRTPFCDSDTGTVIESSNGQNSIFCCNCGAWQYNQPREDVAFQLLDLALGGDEQPGDFIILAVRPSKGMSLKSISEVLVSRLKCK